MWVSGCATPRLSLRSRTFPWGTRILPWAHCSAEGTPLMAFTSTSRKSAEMLREHETVPSTRPRHPREGPPAHRVAAGGRAGAFLHRTARHSENDRWQFKHAHQDLAGGGICFSDQVVSTAASADDLRSDASRAESLRRLH